MMATWLWDTQWEGHHWPPCFIPVDTASCSNSSELGMVKFGVCKPTFRLKAIINNKLIINQKGSTTYDKFKENAKDVPKEEAIRGQILLCLDVALSGKLLWLRGVCSIL